MGREALFWAAVLGELQKSTVQQGLAEVTFGASAAAKMMLIMKLKLFSSSFNLNF